jgi:N-acetylglutamate synthase-like GNAT family acetyltransferase
MLIRDYRRSDAAAITRLFYDTIRCVNLRDYSEQQVRAWAPAVPDPQIWHSRMSQRCTLVAEENEQIIAFAELEHDGHLNMFYCQRDAIRRGVGRSLYRAVELKAVALGLECIFTEASITARAFFEHCGLSTLSKQTVTRSGIELLNFRMEKRLAQSV